MGNSKSKSKKKSDTKYTVEISKPVYSKPEIQYVPSIRIVNDAKQKSDYKLNTHVFKSFSELEDGLRKAGLESSQLIVGIDFTKSNTWQGGYPFYKHKNLHYIDGLTPNPYQQVLTIMCKTLAPFDDDQMIDAYGFGDSLTTNKSVFPFYSQTLNGVILDKPCYKLEGVLERYNMLTPQLNLCGPTSFAPIIRKATELVKFRKQYHILLIIADGAVDDMDESIKAIVEASKYPLSIICIGVGKGSWEKMEEFDENIPARDFDNFHFVDFYGIMQQCENEEAEFAKQAMMEIPDQYTYIKNFIINKRTV